MLVLTAKEAFLVGALAKAVATVVTYPLQVIQSRLRASQGNSEKHDGDSNEVSHRVDVSFSIRFDVVYARCDSRKWNYRIVFWRGSEAHPDCH